MSQQVDRLLFEEVQRLHSGLAQAQANLHRFKELLDKLTAPPWHVGIFLHALPAQSPRACSCTTPAPAA